MTRVRLDTGVELFYTDDGPTNAPALLFVHGWCCDSHDWSWQLGDLAADFRVIAPDLRGHGRSSAPESGYDTVDFATDLLELCDHIDARDIVGIGHSMGAMVLSQMAIDRPRLVRGLVLLDPAYGGDDETAERIRAGIPQLRGSDGMKILHPHLAALEGSDTPLPLRTWHSRRYWGTPHHVAINSFLGMQVTEQAWGPMRLAEKHLAARRCPALSLYVDRRQRQASWESTLNPAVATRVIRSGHWLHQERPDEVTGIIRTWIAALDHDEATAGSDHGIYGPGGDREVK